MDLTECVFVTQEGSFTFVVFCVTFDQIQKNTNVSMLKNTWGAVRVESVKSSEEQGGGAMEEKTKASDYKSTPPVDHPALKDMSPS